METSAHRVLDLEVPPPRAADVATPDGTVRALYDVISGPAETERPRDWDRLRSLCLPQARFRIGRWLEDGESRDEVREWSVEGFIQDARRFYAETGFWEREIRSRADVFGTVAQVFSSYQSHVGSSTDDPVSRGINSVQLIRNRGRWWIVGVVWDVETADNPLPSAWDRGPA